MRLLKLQVNITALCIAAISGNAQHIPKVWDESALRTMELPLAAPAPQPVSVSATYYYSIPVLVIFKSYPAEPPAGQSKADYIQWLQRQEPEISFDARKYGSESDWIIAGQEVFETGLVYQQIPSPLTDSLPRRSRYVIRQKGKLEGKFTGCSGCHFRELSDGRFLNGGPPNATIGPKPPGLPLGVPSLFKPGTPTAISLYATPWFQPDPNGAEAIGSNNTLGASRRAGSSALFPIQVPDLIGIKDRTYLDHTGLNRHRNIGDLMRYAALADPAFGMERYRRYGEFIPFGVNNRELPDPLTMLRFSDEQLYAMALYIYSLKPPPNPNQPGDSSKVGERIFRREGCPVCHTPPLYTNNKLIPAEGFEVPRAHHKEYDILDVRIGLDPTLALRSRRATGYYKVPSLKGVWYRSAFEHNASVQTLEDWFNPERIQDSYVPTGYRGISKSRAVKGHSFGLKLTPDEKRSLIDFLKTL